MAAFAERARRELIATGERVRKPRKDARVVLTPQEEQIARLARDGRSNQEISAHLFRWGNRGNTHLFFNKRPCLCLAIWLQLSRAPAPTEVRGT